MKQCSQPYFFPSSASVLFFVLFLCLSFLQGRAQPFCHTTGGANAIGQLSGFSGNGPQGPFFIKIYVHALARNNGTNGPSNQQIEEAIAAMRKVYAAHNIYFIRDCDIIQINSTELADIADDAGRCLIEQYATHSDGIDIFLVGTTCRASPLL